MRVCQFRHDGKWTVNCSGKKAATSGRPASLFYRRKPPCQTCPVLVRALKKTGGTLPQRAAAESKNNSRQCYCVTVNAALGDKDHAFARLESARQSHDFFMAYMRADFELDSLRPDPRYAELLTGMHMPH